MAILVHNIALPLSMPEAALRAQAARALGIGTDAIGEMCVLRVSLDARRKDDIRELYTLRLRLAPEDEKRLLQKKKADCVRCEQIAAPAPLLGEKKLSAPIVVAGFGPAGIFAAYTLAKNGYRPVVIERGRPVRERSRDVERFFERGELHPESNVMFGEGGAGAFSDGKLTTRIKDPRAEAVVQTLADFGAPEEIRIQAKPHVGTDKLKACVENLRREIIALGAEIRFESRLADIEMEDGVLKALRIVSGGREERIPCAACILAIGQAAHDSLHMLYARGLEMQAKAFAVGLRVEHPRDMIDRAQYGKWAGHARLGAADYRLSEQVAGRGVYTFCMCPGGVVIPAASGFGEVVCNGMSDYARDAEHSNAAVVAQVSPADFGTDPFAGLEFQKKLERDAFFAGGGDYCAPVCRMEDFLLGRMPGRLGALAPSYRPGVRVCAPENFLPDYITGALREGLRAFARRIKGFDMADAVLTGVESRTSAPLRILRDEAGEATRCKGLYPVGEGAGYAGGIVSAAVDGMRAAERIQAIYRPW